MMASVRTWVQGEGGQIAQSLAQGFQLPEDVHFFSGGTDRSLVARLQWHTIAVIHFTLSSLHKCTCIFPFFSCFLLLCYQAAQLAYVIDNRLKEAIEDADQEKALKDIVVATAKDKGKATKAFSDRESLDTS